MSLQRRDVMRQLDRICSSEEFRNKHVMKRFLTYLVTLHVEGRSDEIKAYSIGVDVFERGRDFDPHTNPHVRISAGRLRRSLRAYYWDEGAGDHIRIVVPKGTYVPSITRSNSGLATTGVASHATLPPTIAVLPFRNLTAGNDLDYLAIGFSQELTDALTKFDEFKVIGFGRRPEDDQSHSQTVDEIRARGIGFLVDGDIRSSGTQVKVSFRLIDTSDDSRLAAYSFRFALECDGIFEVQEDIGRRIAAHFGAEYGHINQKRYRIIQQSKPKTLSEQDLLLRYYHYVTVLTPEAAVEYEKAALEALEREPDSALLNALVGGLYSGIYTLDFPGADQAYEKFGGLIEKAHALDPNHQIVKSHLGTKCFLFDERERFFKLYEGGQEWLANSPFRLGAYAMWTCYFGEWELGKQMLAEVIDHNLTVPGWLYGVMSHYHYRRSDYHKALEFAYSCQIPGLFWPHVYRLTALAQLGREDEANKEYQDLLSVRPDFVDRGRHLMCMTIKDSDLIDRILEGFEKIGVTIA